MSENLRQLPTEHHIRADRIDVHFAASGDPNLRENVKYVIKLGFSGIVRPCAGEITPTL